MTGDGKRQEDYGIPDGIEPRSSPTSPGNSESCAALAVVCRAHKAFAPRIERARRVAAALSGLGWDCAFWPPVQAPTPAVSEKSRPVRRTLRKLSERFVLLDRFEPESLTWRSGFASSGPVAGYLLVPNFSPAITAARVLRAAGRPYVVDTGDPWGMDLPVGGRGIGPAARRSRAERDLFGGAAGVVLTTEQQAEEMTSRFPGKPVMVRPNGFQEVDTTPPVERGRRDPTVLRLAHFGRFDRSVRVDPVPFLEALAASGRWERIVMTQFGPDPNELPGSTGRVVIEAREALPWPEAVTEAGNHDAAIVIGNRPERWMQMPSKAIEYLGLPIPRIALCSGAGDSLYGCAARLPGYLVLTDGQPDVAERVIAHVDREWNSGDLEPPEEESWDRVAEEIAAFVDSCLLGAKAGSGPISAGEVVA